MRLLARVRFPVLTEREFAVEATTAARLFTHKWSTLDSRYLCGRPIGKAVVKAIEDEGGAGPR